MLTTSAGADLLLTPCKRLDSNQKTVTNASDFIVGSVVGIAVVSDVAVDISTCHFCV